MCIRDSTKEDGKPRNVRFLYYWDQEVIKHFKDDDDEKGEMREEPIHLLGYSTDSAGFSLSAAAHLMTLRAQETSNGLYSLGLGVDDEKFLAPYYWFLPAICYLDYDHEQRLFLKNLKYETRQLTFWKEDGSIS